MESGDSQEEMNRKEDERNDEVIVEEEEQSFEGESTGSNWNTYSVIFKVSERIGIYWKGANFLIWVNGWWCLYHTLAYLEASYL